MTQPSEQQVLDWLENKGLLVHRNKAEALLLCDANESKLPFMLQILFGLLSLITVGIILFIYLDVDNYYLTQREPFLVAGLLCMAVGLWSFYQFRYSEPLLHLFFSQVSIVSMLVGKILYVIGFAHLSLPGLEISPSWMVSIGIALVTVPFYWLYPVAVDRFISCVFLLLVPLYFSLVAVPGNLAFFLCALTLVVLTGIMFSLNRKTPFWDPFAYACIIAVCITVTMFSYLNLLIPHHLLLLTVPLMEILLGFNLVLALSLCLLIIKNGGGINNFFDLDVIFACFAAVLCAFVGSPLLLLALNLLVLGYGKHDKPIMALGAAFMIAALVTAFVQLEISLKATAGYMIGTGILVLIISFIIYRLKLNRSAQPNP